MNQLNKWRTYLILSTAKMRIAIPKSYIFNPEALISQLEQHSVLFGKPVTGHKGNNVYKFEKTPEGFFHISFHNEAPMFITKDSKAFTLEVQKLIKHKTYLVQEKVPLPRIDGRVYDIRVLIQKNGTGKWTTAGIVSRWLTMGITIRACMIIQLKRRSYSQNNSLRKKVKCCFKWLRKVE